MDSTLDIQFHPIIVLIQSWPFLRHLPFFNSYFKYFKEINNQFFNFHEKQINEHLNSIISPPTDFVEAFLLEKQRMDASGAPHYFT